MFFLLSPSLKLWSHHKATIFVGRTDAEAEAPLLWPSDVKSQLIGKVELHGRCWDPGKD